MGVCKGAWRRLVRRMRPATDVSVQGLPLFADLPEDVLRQELVPALAARSHPPGAVIAQQGAPRGGVLLLRLGEARVVRRVACRRRQDVRSPRAFGPALPPGWAEAQAREMAVAVAVLRPGDVFGAAEAMSGVAEQVRVLMCLATCVCMRVCMCARRLHGCTHARACVMTWPRMQECTLEAVTNVQCLAIQPSDLLALLAEPRMQPLGHRLAAAAAALPSAEDAIDYARLSRLWVRDEHPRPPVLRCALSC